MIRRYVEFLERGARLIVVATAFLVAVSCYLIAYHLPIRADFSYLLPEDAPAIRDLRALEARMPAKDATLVLMVAPDARTRETAGRELIAGLHAIGPDFIERLEDDDAETRAFLRAHKFQLVPLEDLVSARQAIERRIAKATGAFVDLDDEDPQVALDKLRKKRRDFEERFARSSYVSEDGTTQLVVVRTSFRATDVPKDRELLARFDAVFAAVRAAHPGVELGVAGGVPTAVAEHDAVADGILLSSIITSLLVALVLIVHLRGLRLLVLVSVQIVAATIISFGVAAIGVGHLNAATAFLGAIIAGNGVNYGILLVARFLEEPTGDPVSAVTAAIAGTLKPTLVASLGASIAYGALAATRFKGFSDFAIIGGAGMIVCWIVAFSLLPLLLLRFAGAPQKRTGPTIFGRGVVALFGNRHVVATCAVAAVITIAAGVVTYRFIASDPYEYDMARIRSDARAAIEARRWLAISNTAFGRGVIGRTYLAVDRREDVAGLVAQLRALRDSPEGRDTIGLIQSIVDVVPPDQDRRITEIDRIRTLLDHEMPNLEPKERAEIADLRPPDGLKPIADADLPAELGEQFREVDGRMGLIVAVRPGAAFDELDGRAMLRFAHLMRNVSVTKSGTSLIFADILDINRHDGPIVTATAGIGLVIMVLVLVGWNRRAVAVLAGTATGSLAMVAICALVGLRINFLDFVALPIALGLGIDYAINVAHRADRDDAIHTLRTTGGTVFVCSLTTMIGYASLLVSDNHAIRDFGLASLVGEITCVVSALTLVPALVALRSK